MKLTTTLLVLAFLGRLAFSQTPTAPPACTSEDFRQFDFWIGKWTVKNPDGKVVGSSEITRASEGCAVREEWTSGNGKHGMSINYFDAEAKRWHQDWVGGDGTILHLRGGLDGSAMVMSDSAAANRISWTPLLEGKVKQEWATSKDQGKTWQVGFVGIYERP